MKNTDADQMRRVLDEDEKTKQALAQNMYRAKGRGESNFGLYKSVDTGNSQMNLVVGDYNRDQKRRDQEFKMYQELKNQKQQKNDLNKF